MEENISVIANQINESNSSFARSSMTKAVRLAMELSHKKKD